MIHPNLQSMELTHTNKFENEARHLYDIKYRSVTMTDGVSTTIWTIRETRFLEVQPIQWSQREARNRVEIEIGGIKYLPTFYGHCNRDSDVTATDRITKDSGTINLLVLRTYKYPSHMEFDLVEDKGK